MKKLSKLKLQSLKCSEMNHAEMKQITGGVTPLEYCCTVSQLVYYNFGEWTNEEREAAYYALNLCQTHFPNGWDC